MKNVKNTFLVSALSLGLIVGAVGVAGAATSTNYQQQIADWIANDPNPMVMNMNTTSIPTAAPVTTPAATPVAAPAATPVAAPVATPVAPPSTNQATQQSGNQNNQTRQSSIQQTAPKQPTQNYNNGYNGYNGNCWGNDRMYGNWSGNMGW